MSGISAILNLDVWSPDNIPNARLNHDHEYLEAFEKHLHAAVKARLRSRRLPCAIA
jgi:hypothetical protein